MAKVSPNDRSRIIHHLGYGARVGIGAGDLERLEEAMRGLDSNYQVNIIVAILDSCDEWFRIWLLPPDQMISSIQSRELIQGDINRAVIRTGNPDEARKSVWDNYIARTDEIAQQLWVANYRQPENLRYRFERSGGDFINALPGPADTAVGAAHYEITRNSGGFGLPMY